MKQDVMIKWSIAGAILIALFLAFWLHRNNSHYTKSTRSVYTHSRKMIVLYKNIPTKEKTIYPTRLLHIDMPNKEITVETELPKVGWKTFKGKEGERMEGIGYFVKEIHEDKAVIVVDD